MKHNYLKFIGCSIGLLSISVTSLFAQDARVTQYQAIPLVVSPAQTGDFENGPLRLTGLFSRVTNDKISNRIYNGGADLKFGSKERWAIGFNYMQGGSSTMAISGNYAGLSLARKFYLDGSQLQELRLGVQATYFTGNVNERKAYDRFLDLGGFRYWKPENSTGDFVGAKNYLNMSVGAKYKINLNRLKIETGFAAYNITNPDFNIMYNGVLLKRYRVNALSSIYYRTDPKNAFKFEHFSWKEGVYLRDYKATRDTAGIHETTYGLSWYRYLPKHSFNIGVYSRSWQAVSAKLGFNLNEEVAINLSYEAPLYKRYYNVSHAEISLSLYPFAKKKKVQDVAQLRQNIQAIMPFQLDICALCPEKKEVKKPSDQVILPMNEAKMLYADTIYYDFDRYNIDFAAAIKLDKLTEVMKNALGTTLELRAHTDLRGSYTYNETLSENRLRAAKTYLQKNDIDTGGITSSWHGKTQPINNCDNCDDVLQHKNRRSEIRLFGFERKSSLNGPGYTIKIGTIAKGATNQMAVFTENMNVFSRMDVAGNIHYYLGVFDHKEDAVVWLEDLKRMGFKTVEIVPLVK